MELPGEILRTSGFGLNKIITFSSPLHVDIDKIVEKNSEQVIMMMNVMASIDVTVVHNNKSIWIIAFFQ